MSTDISVEVQDKIEELRILRSPTPLWVVLYIYNYAEVECLGLRAKGLWELIQAFKPIEIPTYELLPTPKLFRGYSLRVIASWTNTTSAMIYTCMVKEVIPKLRLGE